MKVTASLKQLLQSEKGVKPDASEQEIRKAVAMAMATDDSFDAKYMATQNDEDAKGGSAIVSALENLNKRLEGLEGKSNPASGLKETAPKMPTGKDGDGTKADDPDYGPSYLEKQLSIMDVGQGSNPRVKSATERYRTEKRTLVFPDRTASGQKNAMAGRPMMGHMRSGSDSVSSYPLMEQSDLEKAGIGAWVKFSLHQQTGGLGLPSQLRMTDHDRDLVNWMLHECDFTGVIGGGNYDAQNDMETAVGVRRQKLSPFMRKALLDDSTSGGLEAVPIFFDDMLITTPLLHSELFPKVKVVNITRGRRIEGASMSNVTLGAATEGTAITLFATANFIAAFDTTIFVCMGSIEIGLDFLSDSPIDIASAVASSYQEQQLKWLDDQIADGDGTTEPEGIMQAAGTTTVNATNGAGGPWTVGDVEALLFGVSKAYKGGTDPSRIGFASNNTTYRRIRGIAVSTTDQRRVFGMTHEDYRIFERFWAINESFGNREAVFGNWFRYRMYRRAGINLRTTQEGFTAVRSNTMLITARSRWGGNLEDGASFAIASDGQS